MTILLSKESDEMIPERLLIDGVSFVLLEKSGKRPIEKDWTNKQHGWNDLQLLSHISNGGNYGVMGGGKNHLVIIDFDNDKVQEEIVKKLPETFTVKTGSGMLHKYYFSDSAESFKIFDEDMATLIDIQGDGKQVVGVGSIHPNGNTYDLLEDKPIAFIPYSELKAIILPYDRKPKKNKENTMNIPKEYSSDNFIDLVKSKVSVKDILSEFGVDTSKNPTNCPSHCSKGGKCLGWNSETIHCFHCDGSWNIFSFIMHNKGCTFKQALEWIAERYGLLKELDESRKKYIESLKGEERKEKDRIKLAYLNCLKTECYAEASEILVKYILGKNKIYTTKEDIKSEMWIYKEGVYLQQGKSEIKEIMRDILQEHFSLLAYNHVLAKIEPDTYIDSDKFFKTNYKYEVPVQNGILNVLTKELKPFTPEKIFFNKLPVVYNPNSKCERINKFLSDILPNEEDKKVFYEIGGYGLIKEYTYEKAVMLVGYGRNGKGKCIELYKRVIGAENCVSLPLASLNPESFSISQLFGRMLNLAGDIGNNDLKDTSMFKSLTGRDLISAKRKFMNDIVFENYAKFIFACNDLPMVYDLSKGFWDRWILLEFPYYFASKEEFDKTPETERTNWKIRDEDIINKITTQEELSGLLNEFLKGLDRLLQNHNFSCTRGSEEIKNTWIRKSNSFIAFCFDNLEENYESFITKKELRKKYSQYCKQHKVNSKSDVVIKKVLQDMFGASDEKENTAEQGLWATYEWVWRGVKWKNQ